MPTIYCPNCNQPYEVEDNVLNEKVECGVCNTSFVAQLSSNNSNNHEITTDNSSPVVDRDSNNTTNSRRFSTNGLVAWFNAMNKKGKVAIISALIFALCLCVLFCFLWIGNNIAESIIIELPNGVNLKMVGIKAGSFEMSANDGENDDDEFPHQATLTKDFYLGQTEVTQAQWRAVMRNNPSEFKGDDLPVESVSWNDAMSFCEKLNELGMAPKGWTFTLPTETQWEYAAKGGSKSMYYKFSGSDNIDEVAWYYDNPNRKTTHPVGKKKGNELGLYDMSGNVWEYCLDDWKRDSSSQQTEFTRGNDSGGDLRMFRGGSWGHKAEDCRVACRACTSPSEGSECLGFRVALVPVGGYDSHIKATSALNTASVPKTYSLSNGVNLEMVKIEAGSFVMSASDDENESDEIAHRVTLTKDFYLGQTEVTQAQWRAVMGSNPSRFKGDDLPVEKISWNDAMSFCEKLNELEKAPSGWKFTLPTETQWEYAASGGIKGRGRRYSGSYFIDDVAWYRANSGMKTHPVKQKEPNELGLYDMSGNVLECCLDDWNDNSSKQKAEFMRGNDRGGSNRVFRGGGWSFDAVRCRTADRFYFAPGDKGDAFGFRVALVPDSF